ncbi:MAG: glycosyltransferase family 4 protein [Akkermansia sp.]
MNALLFPPKILIVTYSFPPDSGGVAGASFDMAKDFVEMGWTVSVLTILCPHLNGSLVKDPCPVIRLSPEECINKHQIAENVITDVCPNVVIIHSWSEWMRTEVMDVCGERAIPVIIRPHGIGTDFGSYFRINIPPFFGLAQWVLSFIKFRKQVNMASKLAQIVFLANYGAVTQCYDCYVAQKKKLKNIKAIPNTFKPFNLSKKVFRENHGLNDCLLFSCLASASSLKKQREVVHMVKKSSIKGCIFLFIIPEVNEYSQLVEKEAGDDPRFRFIYNLPRDEVKSAVAESDVVFLFSNQEQQPLVLLEAMSCGVPWLAPNVGSISTLKGGIVLKKRNKKFFLNAIQSLQDKSLRISLGKEGYDTWNKNYSPDVVYAQWSDLIKGILSKNIKNE